MNSEFALLDDDYKIRLEYEINVINQMGFPTYFLVVWDYIRFISIYSRYQI